MSNIATTGDDPHDRFQAGNGRGNGFFIEPFHGVRKGNPPGKGIALAGYEFGVRYMDTMELSIMT